MFPLVTLPSSSQPFGPFQEGKIVEIKTEENSDSRLKYVHVFIYQTYVLKQCMVLFN